MREWNGGGGQGFLAMEGGLYLDKLFAVVTEFLDTSLLMGPIWLISQGRFKEQVCP